MHYYDIDFEDILMLIALLGAGIVGFILLKKWKGIDSFSKLASTESKGLKGCIIHYVEQVMVAYQSGGSKMPVLSEIVDKKDLVVAEKFFLMSGFCELNHSGQMDLRRGMDLAQTEHFLRDLREGRFNKLLAVVGDTPIANFYKK